ncbi:MAG: hypothetical protein Q3997_02185 [Propionibacteriaceae bacterium]|nr:hypothetical protein [Propionibacteriaceae bacterium]
MSDTEKGIQPLKILAMFKEFATPKYAWLAFGLVVALLTSAFGGMNPVPPEPAKRGDAPAKIEAAPYTLEVGTGWVTSVQPGFSVPSPRERFIVVPVTFTNQSAETVSWSTTADSLRMRGANAYGYVRDRLASESSPEFTRALGGAQKKLQPGVPTEMFVWWHLPHGEPIPQEITLIAHKHTWRQDSLQGHMHWADPEVVSEVRVVLEQRP